MLKLYKLIKFKGEVKVLQCNMEIIIQASEQLMESCRFSSTLHTLLVIGNALNNDDARGVQLEDIILFSHIKGNNGGNLVEFLADSLKNNELYNFWDDIHGIAKVEKTTTEVLNLQLAIFESKFYSLSEDASEFPELIEDVRDAMDCMMRANKDMLLNIKSVLEYFAYSDEEDENCAFGTWTTRFTVIGLMLLNTKDFHIGLLCFLGHCSV